MLSGGATTPPIVPVATQWLYDAVAPGAKGTIDSIVRIRCKITDQVGSGFILDSGYVITNHHVVKGCGAPELEVVTSLAVLLPMASLWLDPQRDLAAMKPMSVHGGTFAIDPSKNLTVGTQLSAWGYPFAHPGPAPLLTVGYLSGFEVANPTTTPVKQLIINGAFNPGDSGGPLISPEGTIIGVVVAKRKIGLTPGIQSALTALTNNTSGLVYLATKDGKPIEVSESQVIANVLNYYREASQVFIGYAVAASELTSFLDKNRIPWRLPRRLPAVNADTSAPTAKRKRAKLDQ